MASWNDRFSQALVHDQGPEFVQEELETAWLRGWVAARAHRSTPKPEIERMAADYAERVVGGSTKPGRPQ